MRRYHFNIYDGISLPDKDGSTLPTWDDARVEAMRIANEVLSDRAHTTALGDNWRLEVTDDYGLILFRIDFAVLGMPVG